MASHGAVWSENKVKALIEIWGESDIQDELDGAVRNKVIFTEIAKKFNQPKFNQGHSIYTNAGNTLINGRHA